MGIVKRIPDQWGGVRSQQELEQGHPTQRVIEVSRLAFSSITVRESDVALIDGKDAIVGYGDAVSVAAEVGKAAIKYLAPYVFRVAISNTCILKLEDDQVTFKYKDSVTDQLKFAPVSGEEFMRRFLQHVLPERFVKARYHGLLSPANRRPSETGSWCS